MTELARKTFRVPRGALLVLVVVTVCPLVVMDAYFLIKYPSLLGHPVLLRMVLRPAGMFLFVVLPACLMRVPVVVESEGLRFAWFFRIKWSDITDANIRKRFGFRYLVVSRRRGFAWQPWLYMYDGLPEFLSHHAPEGNPLRDIRDVSAGETDSL